MGIGSTIRDVLSEILTDLETATAGIVMAVVAVFMPELCTLSLHALGVMGKNFRTFLADINGGRPWGEALAGMMTADWNEVEDDAKQIAIDFAEAVGTAFHKLGLSK